MRLIKRQICYLLEAPLILVATGILLAILLSALSEITGKALVVVSAIVSIGGLNYMIIIPGWEPDVQSNLGRAGKLRIFSGVAPLIFPSAGAYVFN